MLGSVHVSLLLTCKQNKQKKHICSSLAKSFVSSASILNTWADFTSSLIFLLFLLICLATGSEYYEKCIVHFLGHNLIYHEWLDHTWPAILVAPKSCPCCSECDDKLSRWPRRAISCVAQYINASITAFRWCRFLTICSFLVLSSVVATNVPRLGFALYVHQLDIASWCFAELSIFTRAPSFPVTCF